MVLISLTFLLLLFTLTGDTYPKKQKQKTLIFLPELDVGFLSTEILSEAFLPS